MVTEISSMASSKPSCLQIGCCELFAYWVVRVVFLAMTILCRDGYQRQETRCEAGYSGFSSAWAPPPPAGSTAGQLSAGGGSLPVRAK